MSAPIPFTLSFPDMQSGAAFLTRLPLADPQRVHGDLVRFQEALLASHLDALSLLQLLEQSLVPLAFAQEEMAKRFLNRPLPLTELEEAAFQATVHTWRRMASLYSRVAQTLVEGDDTPPRLALILQRCLHYTAHALAEHYRARREVGPGLWLDLHGYYGSAEEWEVATLPVPDPNDPLNNQTHCAAAYSAALLLELAGPYNLSVRNQELARRWACQWAPLVSLHPVVNGEAPPRFAVHLMQDGGLKPLQGPAGDINLRRLDTARLTLQLQQVHQSLKAQVSPADAGLGEGLSASLCVRLLATLFRPWSQAPAQRRFRRHPGHGQLRLALSWEAIHHFVGGKAFVQPENVRVYSRQEFDNLFTFRHQVDPTQPLEVTTSKLTYACDLWEVENESAAGYRLHRRAAGQRLAYGQLLAVACNEEESFMLAQASWLMQEHAGAEGEPGGLVAGIGIMPGTPEAVAARLCGDGHSHSEPYVRAFLLPPVASLEEGPSVVLPLGFYAPHREIEVYTNGPWRLKLDKLLQGGSDFERASFSVCG